jgi:hypothetical protein
MWIWAGCFFFAILALRAAASAVPRTKLSVASPARDLRTISDVRNQLHTYQETLESGLVPGDAFLAGIRELPAPWGRLAAECLSELRRQGCAILPTLKRLRGLAQEQLGAIREGRAKAAQALAQALICVGLVPMVGNALYWVLPGIESSRGPWIEGCAAAMISGGLGAAWMLRLATDARWGGLAKSNRGWLLSSQCAGEAFLALLRSGMPVDLAWTRACEMLSREAPGLAGAWGFSLWQEPTRVAPSGNNAEEKSDTGRMIVDFGFSLRRALQASVMEGRPCAERVEAAMAGLARDLRAQVDREMGLLGARAMKPLFACVAPALLGLLFFGLYLSWQSMGVAL